MDLVLEKGAGLKRKWGEMKTLLNRKKRQRFGGDIRFKSLHRF